MNLYFFIASLLCFFAALAHAYYGQAVFLKGLKIEDLPTSKFGDQEMSKNIYAVVWHMVSVIFLVFSMLLGFLSFVSSDENTLLVLFPVVLFFLLSEALIVIFGYKDLKKLFRVPQFYLFLGIAVLVFLGSYY